MEQAWGATVACGGGSSKLGGGRSSRQRGAGLQCSGEPTEWLGSLLEAPGAYQYPWSEQEKIESMGSPVMAVGGRG